jgi:hypothetical protein
MSRNADCNSIHRRFVTDDTWTKVAQLGDGWYSPSSPSASEWSSCHKPTRHSSHPLPTETGLTHRAAG